MLQCGDPTATGRGGPGYTVPDENPTDLKEPADPVAAQQGLRVYPRGVVALATKSEPNTGGSQFFIVFGDSTVQPIYPVFGKIDEVGLATLDKIAAGGITPGLSPEDGEPKVPVTIESATIGDK